ncbi:hypothetical protein [Streptococcus suis]|uniref:hypothetical protein n=1 Tax=Streptococcus suis TaxID=1307 RepID=UPI003BA0D0D7
MIKRTIKALVLVLGVVVVYLTYSYHRLHNPIDEIIYSEDDKYMTDTRWLGTEGWVKMQRVVTLSDGTKIISTMFIIK